MNTKQAKSRSILLLAILLIADTAIGWAAKPESVKKKEISKSFNVSRSDLLLTDNRYGNTTITHWDKNEVQIRVEIEAKAKNDEQAQTTLDRVQIEIKKTGNTISAVTSLKEQSSSFWNNGNRNERFTINYFISMPSKLAIDLSQKYGNINLPEKNEGKSTIQVKYGNLNAGSFTQPLDLEVKYGNVKMDDVTRADMDFGYCGSVSIGNAEQINADNKYSNMNIKNCTRIDLENKYGNVSIKSLDKGSIEIKYSEAHIDLLKDRLDVGELAYSSLTIKEISANFSNLSVDAHYGNLNVGIPSRASFKVSAENMKYGNYDIRGFNITNSYTEDKVNHYYEINGGKKGEISFDGNNYSNINVNAF